MICTKTALRGLERGEWRFAAKDLGIPFAIGRWGRVQNAKERPGKVALIVKAAVHGDCRNRRVGLA